MKNVLEYLEATMSKYPDKAAVEDENISYTFRELVETSKKFGSVFGRLTEAGKPVVILAEKSALTLAAMFGTVYAGCFYVMADPSQPTARIKEIFRVLSPELVVATEDDFHVLEQIEYTGKFYLLKEIPEEGIDLKLLEDRRMGSSDTDLLYGIFTSGSTGVPKGIVVSHRSVIDFITHFVETFGFDEHDKIGNQAPFDFDVSVKDIYTGVMTGATLLIIPKKFFSIPTKLLDYICDRKTTVLIWAVSALTLVSSLKGLKYRVPQDVEKILFSGEVMPLKQLKQWQEALPDTEFVNLYGPTEITCNCTYYPIERMFQETEKLPIGRGFAGRKVLLLDDEGNEIWDADKTGEICVMGESLSEGYYNNPEETEKRFIEHKCVSGETGRCYKTGDLGYFGADGELYFCGRKDFQIKHMGHRIELEEIEHAVNRIDGVDRCCCMMDYRKNQLVAFYMGETPSEDIKKQLKQWFPIWMIPHKIIVTENMPLNKNGKTDREYLRQQLEVRK